MTLVALGVCVQVPNSTGGVEKLKVLITLALCFPPGRHHQVCLWNEKDDFRHNLIVFLVQVAIGDVPLIQVNTANTLIVQFNR